MLKLIIHKAVLIIFFIFIYSYGIFAQQGVIKGIASDSLTRKPIQYTSVRLLSLKDSVLVSGTSTNEFGKFSLKPAYGNYLLEISYLGYKPYRKQVKTSKQNPNYDLGNIYLIEDTQLLDEAVVTAKVPDIQVKGDTIEYNAASYTSDESDLLQDLIKRIPGIELDANGNLTANGKPIKKILVDGKEFFGNDIKMALENLSANMIKKLQLFKEESDKSKVTGFKDGDEQQVLNLNIKDEFKRNLFGDASVGFGNHSRYSHRLMANYMHDENQFSIVGTKNNIGGLAYAMQALSLGLEKNENIGSNFAVQASDKLNISGDVSYSNNNNLYETQNRDEYFLPSRISTQNSSSNDMRKGLNSGVYLDWKPDSLTTIYFRLSGDYNTNKSRQTSDRQQYADIDTTFTNNNSNNKGDGYNINSSFVIGRKLNSKGRNISLSFNNSIRKDDKDGFNQSLTRYTSGADDIFIDQKSNTNSHSDNFGIGLTYVEPINDKSSIKLDYNYNQNTTRNDRKTYNKDSDEEYSILDKNYSRNSRYHNSIHNINLGFQTITDKYEYSAEFSVKPSYSSRKSNVLDSIIDKLSQNVVEYSPTLRFQYKFGQTSTLDVNYTGSTNHPEISQLSKDTVRNASGTDKSYGNPDLKASYTNGINATYMTSNYETGRFIWASLNFNQTFNDIAGYTKVDTLNGTWNTESSYKNVNGRWNSGLMAFGNFPLKNKKFSINGTSSVNYSRNVGFTNGLKNISGNWNLSNSIGFKFRNEKVDTYISAIHSYNSTHNNISKESNSNVSTFGINHMLNVKLPWDFSIQSVIKYSYNSGYSSDFKKSETLWSASISKNFLKKKKGLLKAQFYDILKDRSNVSRSVSATSISDTRTNAISRYFMLSFSYRFNFSKGNSQPDETNQFYY